MSRLVSRGSTGEYQADEQEGVAQQILSHHWILDGQGQSPLGSKKGGQLHCFMVILLECPGEEFFLIFVHLNDKKL